MSDKYVCENCGDIIEIEKDLRAENSRYDGDLKHTVPVCYCQQVEKDKETERLTKKMSESNTDLHDFAKETLEYMEYVRLLMENKKYADAKKIVQKVTNNLKIYA